MRIPHLVAASLVALLCGTAQADLVITEIMVNPSGARDDVASNSDEWFEILNTGTAVDLSTVKYDTDADASNGTALSGTVASGGYLIVGNRNASAWQAAFGALPVGATYLQISPWKILANTGGTLTLFDTTTSTNFFSLNYGSTTNGASLQFTGNDANTVSPYVFGVNQWQNATTSPGGNSGDFHSAGSSNIQASPEPAAVLLMVLSGAMLFWISRKNSLHATT